MDGTELPRGPQGNWERLKRWNHEGGWGSRRWYFAWLIPFEVAMVMVVVGVGGRDHGLWFVVRLTLVAISGAAMLGGEVVPVDADVPDGYRSEVGRMWPASEQ